MKNNNQNSTRYYSDAHEKSVCNALGGRQTANSGAGKWKKGDVIVDKASMLVECKTCMKDKDSFSIKKEWFDKNKDEAFSNRLSNQCVCFNFGPNQSNYYIINQSLMKFLIEKLEEIDD